jgi:hypothetical protein
MAVMGRGVLTAKRVNSARSACEQGVDVGLAGARQCSQDGLYQPIELNGQGGDRQIAGKHAPMEAEEADCLGDNLAVAFLLPPSAMQAEFGDFQRGLRQGRERGEALREDRVLQRAGLASDGLAGTCGDDRLGPDPAHQRISGMACQHLVAVRLGEIHVADDQGRKPGGGAERRQPLRLGDLIVPGPLGFDMDAAGEVPLSICGAQVVGKEAAPQRTVIAQEEVRIIAILQPGVTDGTPKSQRW